MFKFLTDLKNKIKKRAREEHERACQEPVGEQLRKKYDKAEQDADKVMEVLDRVGVVDKAERAAAAIQKKFKRKG